MYLDYWGLKVSPFGTPPNRNLFYRSPQHEEALIRLLYAVENRQGAAMMTGEVGAGKTTVTRALIKSLDEEKFEVKVLFNPALNPLDLIRAILLLFGEETDSNSKTVLLSRLQDRLIRNAREGLSTVLAIDEAHVIKDQATLDELRMLLNMQLEDQFLVTLILLGQPPLLKNISALQPLKERISIKYHLDPLDLQNIIRYILFRLKSAGATRAIFTKQSIYPLYEYTKGIPLRVNNICDRSLLIGLMKKARLIDSKIVNDAIKDLK